MKKKKFRIVVSKKTVNVLGKVGKVLVAVFVLAGVALVSARVLGKVAVSNITDSLRQVKYVFAESKDYPYTMEALNTRFVDCLDDELIILYNDHTQTLNSLAVPMLSIQTASSDTKVYTANGRALVVDSSENKVILQSKTEKLGEITSEDEISAAALGNNGCFAIATKPQGAQSNLTIYNTKLEKVFSWNCSNERISDISLSKNGKNVVVSVIGADNAKLYSRLVMFDTAQPQPVADVRLDSTLLLDVVFTAKDCVIAVGDNCARSYSAAGEQISELAFTENSLSHTASDEKGNTAVCVSEFGGSKSRLVCFGDEGEIRYNLAIEGEVTSVSMHKGKAAALSGSVVTLYSDEGEALKTLATASTPDKIILYGAGIYSVEKAEIFKYKF